MRKRFSLTACQCYKSLTAVTDSMADSVFRIAMDARARVSALHLESSRQELDIDETVSLHNEDDESGSAVSLIKVYQLSHTVSAS